MEIYSLKQQKVYFMTRVIGYEIIMFLPQQVDMCAKNSL
ncbi:hypothetical protein ND00_20640 [Clostridium sp. L74]|nr:hypothetical protein ND00_20640 [Clostridium sp. L74]